MENYTSLHFIDYAIVIITLMASIGIGFRFAKGQKDTSKYFTARGSLPSWAIGISILATIISSVTFLAYPGDGFSSNWIKLVQGLMGPIVLVLVIGFIVPLFRNVIRLSAYEYFEQRFGLFSRIYSSVSFILTHFSKMGTVFFLIALALGKMVGMETTNIIWIIGLAVILLTMVGGMEAVVWLDVIQGFLLIVGGLVAFFILVFSIDGGLSTIWEVASANDRTGFGSFDMDFVNLGFWVMAINGIFYAIQKYATDQTMVQRYLTAKTDKDAKRATIMGVLLSIPVWALFMFIGTALFTFYNVSDDILPQGIRPDAVFPHFIMTRVPVGLVGIIISALIAAAISSLDSDLNCLSAIAVEDYYIRFKPQSTEKQRMLLSKTIIVLAGLAAIGVAMFYVKAGGKGVLGIVFTLYSIFSGGLAGMFILGVFFPRANKQGLYYGIGASVLFTSYALLTSTPIKISGTDQLLLDLGNCNFAHHKYMIGVYSHIVLFVVGLTASYFYEGKKIDEQLTYKGWKKTKNCPA